jgi:hypothetical protein
MESIMLLCQDEQIKRRLHVCMLVKDMTVEVKLREKYEYLLKEAAHDDVKERQLIRENFEKLFDAHLTLPGLNEENIEELLISFLEMSKDKYVEQLEAKEVKNPPSSPTVPQPENRISDDPETDFADETELPSEDVSDIAETEEIENEIIEKEEVEKRVKEEEKPADIQAKQIYQPIKFSDAEKAAIIQEAQKFKEPYKNYWSPRSLKRLTTQFLLVRSLLSRHGWDKVTTEAIIATILHLQGFESKPGSGSTRPIPENDQRREIIRMVVWKPVEEPTGNTCGTT